MRERKTFRSEKQRAARGGGYLGIFDGLVGRTVLDCLCCEMSPDSVRAYMRKRLAGCIYVHRQSKQSSRQRHGRLYCRMAVRGLGGYSPYPQAEMPTCDCSKELRVTTRSSFSPSQKTRIMHCTSLRRASVLLDECGDFRRPFVEIFGRPYILEKISVFVDFVFWNVSLHMSGLSRHW